MQNRHGMIMDLRRLRAFVAVAEHGTVSKAAALMHLTQPALSRQVGSLEQEFGFKLFERAGRRLALTPRGQQMLGEARGILSNAANLRDRAQALRRGEIQVLRIAASALTIEAIFPKLLRRLAVRAPELKLVLIDAEADRHLTMLERGDAHLAINVINTLSFDDRTVASFVLHRFHLLAVFSATCRARQARSIDIVQLAQQPLLLLRPGNATRGVFDSACGLASVRPDIVFESGAVHTLLGLAAAGYGVAVVPSVLRIDPKAFWTCVVTHRRGALALVLATLWDRRRMPAKVAETVSGLISEHLGEVFPSRRSTRMGK
ncbi:MAG: LysR family transcriptional regulator [Alphaproteobacteria bacterium]|nr:LysR family transcriptional regulator [Alphaproteobacteria bacterium]